MSTEQFAEPPTEMLEPWGKSGPDAQKEALEGIKHLWKLDDPEWVEKREQDWLLIRDSDFEDTPKKERKLYENYFKYGQKEGFLGGVTTVILTPYENVEEFDLVYRSQLLGSVDRNDVFTLCIYIYRKYESLDWYKSHVKIMMSTLLKSSYEIVQEQTNRTHIKDLSPEPSFWSGIYINRTSKALKTNDDWNPVYECLDYFISILAFVLEDRDRIFNKLQKLLDQVSKGLDSDSLSGEAKLFAEDVSRRKPEILEAWEIGERKIEALYE